MKDILRASYDRSAVGYDEQFRPLQRPKYLALLGPRGGEVGARLEGGARGLDLGCGTGLLAEWLLAEGGAAPRLFGLDLSHGMAVRARARGVAVAEGEKDRLPFRDGAFEVILSFTSLRIAPGPEARALAEVSRVLAPGGWLGLSVLKEGAAGLERELRAAGLAPGARRDCGQDWGFICTKSKGDKEMALAERISADIVTAMKQKDAARLDALRAAKTALTKAALDSGKPLDDAGAAKLVEVLIKQRREAVELYRKGGREELAAKDEAQIAVLESYLPKALGRDELVQAVEQAIAETGAKEPREQGLVMKAVMAKLAGKRVDGKEVSQIVGEKLKQKA